MGSVKDLESMLRLKEDKIKELQRLLDEKNDVIKDRDDVITQLRSKLDKFQSVLPQTTPTSFTGPRSRTFGISAESHSQAVTSSSHHDLATANFRKHSKTNQ